MAFRLQPNDTVGKEIFRLLQEQTTRAIRAAGDKRYPAAERARQARVACKKIRAALELVRCHAPKRFKREGRCFRDAARSLADIRDHGAVLSTLQRLHRSTAHHVRINPLSFRHIREALDDHHRHHSGASVKAGAVLQTFCHKLKTERARLEHTKLKGAKQDGFAFIEAGFRRSYARARTTFYKANESAHDDALHTWRKRTKTHLNQCRLLERTCPGIMPPRVRELKRLTSLLGDEHDLTILRERIGDTDLAPQNRSTVKAIRQQIVRRLTELRAEALAMGQSLFLEKPRDFAPRVATGWNASQSTSPRSSRKAQSDRS